MKPEPRRSNNSGRCKQEVMLTNLKYPRAQALQNPETLATVVHAILLEQYGEQVYDWDPVTVYLETQADFNADMTTEVMDKWNAMQIVMSSNAFFQKLDAFLAVCNTLAEGDPFFGAFNPVTVEEAAWALAEVSLNREMLPFSYTIKAYLRLILKEEGFSDNSFPAIFKEVFDKEPSADDIRDSLAAMNNETNLDLFIQDRLADIVHQFNAIPDMAKIDDLILDRGLVESIQATRLL